MHSTSVVITNNPRPRPGSRVTNPPAQSSQRHHAQRHHAQRTHDTIQATPSSPTPRDANHTIQTQEPAIKRHRPRHQATNAATAQPIQPTQTQGPTDPEAAKRRVLQGQPTCRYPGRRTGVWNRTKGAERPRTKGALRAKRNNNSGAGSIWKTPRRPHKITGTSSKGDVGRPHPHPRKGVLNLFY